ncbi:hypothetical protein ACFQ88_04140 [Paenibacillus sp. NPDC056579]|uniref:hypothetical protein n=1 Tax=unclassified Paenibacillus TaxID=185978 RepID=UPI001EF788B9|nr:hypothetical protein [Paenibacillus sp. H1-7]ULL16193.1 hypothetical protein DVH26_18120 [Paenibacillus sp. H1-7]
MEADDKKRLEEKFDRDLTDGEAAEIMNTPVLHSDDENYYENDDMDLLDTIPIGLQFRQKG